MKVKIMQSDLDFIIRVSRVALEEEIAKQDKIAELFWVSAVEGVRFLGISSRCIGG